MSHSYSISIVDSNIDIVREFVEDEFIKIIFVKSEENHADVFTKNVNREIFEKHVENFVGKDETGAM